MSISIDQNLASLHDSFDRYSRVAQKVAHDGAGGDLAENLVELMQISAQVKANVISMRTTQETLGSLLDVFA